MSILFYTERIDAFVAKENDLDRILEIQNHPENCDFIWINNKLEYLEFMKTMGMYVVVFRRRYEDEIIGFGILVHNDIIDSLEFKRMAIMDKSKGYGQEIIKGVQQFAFRCLKVHRLWLETYTFNYKGIYIYEKLNFKREGTQRDVYKDHRGYLSEHIYSMLEYEYK